MNVAKYCEISIELALSGQQFQDKMLTENANDFCTQHSNNKPRFFPPGLLRPCPAEMPPPAVRNTAAGQRRSPVRRAIRRTTPCSSSPRKRSRGCRAGQCPQKPPRTGTAPRTTSRRADDAGRQRRIRLAIACVLHKSTSNKLVSCAAPMLIMGRTRETKNQPRVHFSVTKGIKIATPYGVAIFMMKSPVAAFPA